MTHSPCLGIGALLSRLVEFSECLVEKAIDYADHIRISDSGRGKYALQLTPDTQKCWIFWREMMGASRYWVLSEEPIEIHVFNH